MPMSPISFSLLLQKGLIICVLESIFFFSLLRMIVILFQEYYLNDNIYIYIFDITSNNVYKQSFIILYQFNAPILLGHIGLLFLTVACLFLSSPLCYMLRFVSLPNKRRYIIIIGLGKSCKPPFLFALLLLLLLLLFQAKRLQICVVS